MVERVDDAGVVNGNSRSITKASTESHDRSDQTGSIHDAVFGSVGATVLHRFTDQLGDLALIIRMDPRDVIRDRKAPERRGGIKTKESSERRIAV